VDFTDYKDSYRDFKKFPAQACVSCKHDNVLELFDTTSVGFDNLRWHLIEREPQEFVTWGNHFLIPISWRHGRGVQVYA
jgi:hypothetical protein